MALVILKRSGPRLCFDVVYLLQSYELLRALVTGLARSGYLSWLSLAHLSFLLLAANAGCFKSPSKWDCLARPLSRKRTSIDLSKQADRSVLLALDAKCLVAVRNAISGVNASLFAKSCHYCMPFNELQAFCCIDGILHFRYAFSFSSRILSTPAGKLLFACYSSINIELWALSRRVNSLLVCKDSGRVVEVDGNGALGDCYGGGSHAVETTGAQTAHRSPLTTNHIAQTTKQSKTFCAIIKHARVHESHRDSLVNENMTLELMFYLRFWESIVRCLTHCSRDRLCYLDLLHCLDSLCRLSSPRYSSRNLQSRNPFRNYCYWPPWTAGWGPVRGHLVSEDCRLHTSSDRFLCWSHGRSRLLRIRVLGYCLDRGYSRGELKLDDH